MFSPRGELLHRKRSLDMVYVIVFAIGLLIGFVWGVVTGMLGPYLDDK